MSCTTFSKNTMLRDDCHDDLSARRRQVSTPRLVNLELHQLIWLDPDFNRKNDISIGCLRNIVDYTKVFDKSEDCLEYIEQTQDTITFLVCTKELAQEFIPRIYHLKNIIKVYVIFTSENHQKSFSNYSKVTEVNKEIVHLLDDLSADVNEYQKHEKLVDFSGFDKIDQTTDYYGRSWWYGFIRLLVALPYSKDSCRKLIEFLKVYYEGQETQLNILAEFEANYQSNEAIRWYTRPIFLFGLLNKALRQHNIKIMFLFGFFVQDLYRQLETEFETFKLTHLEHSLIVKSYRGQVMHLDEIKQLKIGHFIIINSFFSTTLSRQFALIFTNSLLKSDDQFQNVLFEFESDVRHQGSNIFANISSLSHFPDESEVLFMAGCTFEIQDIIFDETENYWLVKMDLYYAYRYQEYRIHENAFNTTIRRTLQYCLSKLTINIARASDDDINILFNELIDLFLSEEKWISAIKLECLARHKYERSRYHTEPISYFKQALEIWNDYIEDNELNCLVNIGEIHKMMAVCYEEKHPADKNLALMHCDLAISYTISANDKTHTDLEKIDMVNRLANLYSCKMHITNNTKENAPMAIKYLELAIQEMLKYYSKNDIMIISRITELADNFISIDKYNDALTYYENVLDIHLQQPKPLLNWINTISRNIVNIYIKRKYDYNSALRYELINHECVLKSQISHRTDDVNAINWKKNEIALSYENLSVVHIKFGQYNLAYTNLMIAMKLHEEILQSPDIHNTMNKVAKIKIKLADISVKLHQYDLASEHLESAMRLCEGRSKLDNEKSEVANIDIKLVNGYTELQQYNLADQHLARAMNIYREINDSQYELRTRVTTVINGRIKRCKRSCTIVYVTKYDHIRSYFVVFLDSKIRTVSRRVVYNEIRRIYNRRK